MNIGNINSKLATAVVNGIGLHGVGTWDIGEALAAVWTIRGGKWS